MTRTHLHIDIGGDTVFHLPGKHDQESHGDPGVKKSAKSSKKNTSKTNITTPMSVVDFNARRDVAAEGDGVYESVEVDDTMDSIERLIDDGKLKSITVDQVSDGYQHYTDLGYQTMNAGLRGSTDLSKLSLSDRNATRTLDKVIEASPLKTDIIVYRGIVNPRQMFGDAYVDSDEEDANRGLTWIDDGFTSTSISIDAFENFASGSDGVAMNILVPKGSHAAGTPDSANENEYEITLPRGSTFRVVASRRNDEGQMEFDVEVVT